MSEENIDRQAWAALMRELILSEARGNKSAFSRKIGVTTRTLDRWLAAEVDVSEKSVREVARAINKPTVDMLMRAGYVRPEELPISAARPGPIDEDVLIIMRRLADPDTPEAEKTSIRATLRWLADLASRTEPNEGNEGRPREAS